MMGKGRGWTAGAVALTAAVAAAGLGGAQARQDTPVLMPGVTLDGWTYVSEDRKSQKFYKREADLNGNPVLSNRIEYRVDQGDAGQPAFSYMSTDAYRCSDGAVRSLTRSMYAEHNLVRRVTHDDQVQLWEPATPGSLMEQLHKIACAGRTAAALPPVLAQASPPAQSSPAQSSPAQAAPPAQPAPTPVRPAPPPAIAAAPPPAARAAPPATEEEEEVKLIAGVVAGDWFFAGETESGQMLVRPGKATRVGNPTIQTRMEYFEVIKDGRVTALSSGLDYEIRCRDGRLREMKLTHYAGHNLKGRSVKGEIEDGWDQLSEDSLLTEFVAWSCDDGKSDGGKSGGGDEDDVALIPGVILGEWTFIEDLDIGQVFARRADAAAGDNPHIWIRTETRGRTLGGRRVLSTLSLTEFDCARGTFRDLQFDAFAGHNMTGARSSEGESSWRPVTPDGMSGLFHAAACDAPKT